MLEARAATEICFADLHLPTMVGPPLGVGPTGVFGVPRAERDRIAVESAKAAVLVTNASVAQQALLVRLVRAAPDKKVQFTFLTTLELFLAATENADQNITDEELATLWEAALK
ncbi:MAG TPA: hypothetical protein VNG33_13625 [Polyangiaceae bacterium]|nr:hypothetical protein [Polyangiaceae bacterium]